jgi:hypothetical protein
MMTIEELAATVELLASRVAALEARLPAAPRAALRQLEPEGATITEYMDRVPALLAGDQLDQLFEKTLLEHPEVARAGDFIMSELRADFALALRYIASRARLAEVDKTKHLQNWIVVIENWHLDRRESSSITIPALLLAAFADGIAVEIGRHPWTGFLGLSEKPRQTAPIERSAAA